MLYVNGRRRIPVLADQDDEHRDTAGARSMAAATEMLAHQALQHGHATIYAATPEGCVEITVKPTQETPRQAYARLPRMAPNVTHVPSCQRANDP